MSRTARRHRAAIIAPRAGPERPAEPSVWGRSGQSRRQTKNDEGDADGGPCIGPHDRVEAT